jgi:hypothetical protein
MTSILDTPYDRTTTQLLRDALKRSHEDAGSIGLGIDMMEYGPSSSADPKDRRPHSADRVRVLDDRSRYDLAVASSDRYDLGSSLSALMRAGLVLSWIRDIASARKPIVTVEQEWEREEDWQRVFM